MKHGTHFDFHCFDKMNAYVNHLHKSNSGNQNLNKNEKNLYSFKSDLVHLAPEEQLRICKERLANAKNKTTPEKIKA